MTDKEKRIQKILAKTCLKGKLKSVKTFEESGIVIVENPSNESRWLIFDKNGFIHFQSNGKTFPEDRVHFLVSTNPRNKRLVEKSILCNTNRIKDPQKPEPK